MPRLRHVDDIDASYRVTEPWWARGIDAWTGWCDMTRMRSIVGALSIMAAAGTIADFDVVEADSVVYVRVWSADDRDGSHLQREVAALLLPHADEHHVTVVSASAA